MSEGGVGTCPQVFVVDSQASFIQMPSETKPRWARDGQKFLLLLVGMSLLGLIIEGCFIYNLYKKTEEFSSCRSHHLCHNLSNPATSMQQDGTAMGRAGSAESNEIPLLQSTTKDRPFAHLLGANQPIDEGNVMQWVEEGEAVIQNMTHEKGRLMVLQTGYYYLYSKVQLNAEECTIIQHKVMKDTSAYGKPLELLKSKRYRCWTPKPSNGKAVNKEEVWSSFLAGIFHLQKGDKIFVTFDKPLYLRQGPTENFMGAFMISP
ncbi:tumor necrosis factor ligand superfamily member 14-like [Cololabis saira]|uniref:tumor necrosis factor ligand superfamily member 14-like n=1 Tax=Cololabis saira TaxID=129043 RepID=UPI002AD46538|nr:tumor necrosis factor ligand superfamily member 14-like [Cololabis saira]XP_061588048.1 tumor necrosis factor ligand superfamily member 14-like [Cololabis saira]